MSHLVTTARKLWPRQLSTVVRVEQLGPYWEAWLACGHIEGPFTSPPDEPRILCHVCTCPDLAEWE